MPKAQHLKAASFVRQNLFVGVKRFAELEARIEALPDEQSRGGAFEVFAEAYLAIQRKHDAAKVWPLASVPTTVLKRLGLGQQDYGVDGVFQTLLGNFSAYQVKFRINRPALTWRELSTFVGLADSPHVRSRVLITNCDELASVLNERQGFFCIRGSDLDRLEADDFRAIEAWLADAAFVPPKKQPQPHQIEALHALLPALQTHDRVSAIMACGTGKTLIALWVAEHVARASSPESSAGIPAARILVLVPSLALLRQILHEWLRETSLPNLAYLCVCSDPTVKEGIDAIATQQSDLDFQVSTDAKSVRDFLGAPFTGVKIVFSTYQSAQVVGAALKAGERFDLGVFDEAHKTAGREGRNYAFALEDANLPIRKRLFLTATPRHYNPLRKDKEGDAQLVFSMDRPEVYGPQAFRLTFAEAARRGIICGYKVIISVITSEMVTNELLSRGEVIVNGEAVRARQVANQIALRDAIEKYGVKKVFTFHSTVKSAASFVSDSNEGIGSHLADVRSPGLSRSGPPEGGTPNFQTFHVNGTMPTARREREMRDFRAAARAVMSNARCLTEGVDVPAVDMVAFLSPRRSRVDIVQATGRAMRRSPGKTTGYVLVPLYVEQAAGETVEAAVSRAKFDEVWEVLQSLQEQDDVLAEIIREMREEQGRVKGFDDSRFRERVEIIGPSLSLDAIRKAITATCIENLVATWEERFGELQHFKQRFGHCDVPQDWPQNSKLANWVRVQRASKAQSKLSRERFERLESIGLSWHTLDSAWEKLFEDLVAFKHSHGHCNVPHIWREHRRLGFWVAKQRSLRKGQKLEPDRFERLSQIGFVWALPEASWEGFFDALVDYTRRFGSFDVPRNWPENPKLARWVSSQRVRFSKGKLAKERSSRLEKIGFVWNTLEVWWEEMFAALIKYKETHGDCRVPQSWPDNPRLGSWVGIQRSLRKQQKLSLDRVRRLERIGFIWTPINDYWEEMFKKLEAFRRKHGHCAIPDKLPDGPSLSTWVRTQRRLKKLNKLTRSRIQRLNSVGFEWDPFASKWEKSFAALADYQRHYGNCNVPRGWNESPTLGNWVTDQRLHRKKGTLELERIERLDAIGFSWSPKIDFWEEMFAALVSFKNSHKNCNVPQAWPENPKLGRWVANQRHVGRQGKLDRRLKRRLESLGFLWDPIDATWEMSFSELLDTERSTEIAMSPGGGRRIRSSQVGSIRSVCSRRAANSALSESTGSTPSDFNGRSSDRNTANETGQRCSAKAEGIQLAAHVSGEMSCLSTLDS